MWDRTENQITIHMIRHGETPSNREHRYLGHTDESLSQEGIQALQRLKEKGIYPKADMVFSSPMNRCIETADILYPGQKISQILEWKEMNFGAFEGKNYKELNGDLRYQAWIDSNGTLAFPGGEGRDEFVFRCQKGFCHMLRELEKQPHKEQQRKLQIALIVHGGTIMALLSSFYGGEYFDYQTSNGRGYSCQLETAKDERPRLAGLYKL